MQSTASRVLGGRRAFFVLSRTKSAKRSRRRSGRLGCAPEPLRFFAHTQNCCIYAYDSVVCAQCNLQRHAFWGGRRVFFVLSRTKRPKEAVSHRDFTSDQLHPRLESYSAPIATAIRLHLHTSRQGMCCAPVLRCGEVAVVAGELCSIALQDWMLVNLLRRPFHSINLL